jgi:surface polysaccharide O-acyltransferase-like enzyme
VKRQSGIDLIRITGLFFVVGVHQFLYNRFYYEPQMGFWMWSADVWRWLFFCCNGIFMMLSGYLRCGKTELRDCYRGLIPVLIGYTLCCLIIFPIQAASGERMPILAVGVDSWLKRFVTFGNYAWYVEMYIGLILFSPVINLGLKQMNEKTLGRFSNILVFVTSAYYMTALDLIPNYWSALYPVTYYILGAAIRRLQPKVKTWEGLGLALLISMGLAGASIVTTDEGFSKGFTQGYGGIWTMLTASGIFLGLYRVKVRKGTGKILAWLAGGVFEGYLLSKIFDIWTYPLVKQWHTPDKLWLVFLVVTVPTFICTLLLGKLVSLAADAISNRISWFRKKSPMKR